MHNGKGIYFPWLLQSDHAPAFKQRDVCKHTIKRDEFEQRNADHDGMVGFETEVPGDNRP